MKYRWLGGFLCLILVLTSFSTVAAQTYLFQVEAQKVNLFINEDGSASIEYTIDFYNEQSADPIDFVDIGLPNSSYDLSSITAEIDGKPISHIKRSQYVNPGIELGLGSDAIKPGARGQVHVWIGNVSNMLFKTSIEGKGEYASFNFMPNYFGSQYVKGSTLMEVTLYLPPGIEPEEPVYYTPKNWPGAEEPVSFIDDQDRVYYNWSADNANAHSEYLFGAAFPLTMVPEGVVQAEPVAVSGSSVDLGDSLCCGIFFVGFAAFFGWTFYAATVGAKKRKLQYLPPKIAIEGHGIKRGLTAVEAAILLEQPMDKILTMILFSTLKKEAAVVITQDPLELEMPETLPDDLRAYEIEFLEAFRNKDKKKKRDGLQELMINLVQSVSKKMKGFSLRETVDYYKNIIEKAWQHVESAATPDVKVEKYDEAMDWTMLDKNYDDRTKDLFGPSPVLVRPPTWWWRYDPMIRPSSAGAGGTTGSALPTSPLSQPFGSSSTSPSLPGATLAASMVNSVQNFSSNVIGDLNAFTGNITEKTNPIPKTTTRSSGGGGGRSCACACACAGCACACAGGGR